MKQYLAIDIGGTAVKLGIVDEEGRALSKTEQSVCFDNYETPILTTVLSAAEQFLKEQAVEPQGLAGIGVSAAGQYGSVFYDPLRMEGERVVTATNHNGGVNGGITNGMQVVFK